MRLDLVNFKKDTADPAAYKQFYLALVSGYHDFQKIFTEGSKSDDKVAAPEVTFGKLLQPLHMLTSERQYYIHCITSSYPSSSPCVYHSEKAFLVLSNSLSSLQALHNMHYDDPLLIKFHELYSE